jgi:hypothetical protein
MFKLRNVILIALLCGSVALAEDFFAKVIEKRTSANTTVVLDSVFTQPRVLDCVYIFVPETETSGAFTNLCTLSYARSTNSAGTVIGSSSQSVHFVSITNLDLKVIEGDVLYVTNTMSRTTVRMFFK